MNARKQMKKYPFEIIDKKEFFSSIFNTHFVSLNLQL